VIGPIPAGWDREKHLWMDIMFAGFNGRPLTTKRAKHIAERDKEHRLGFAL
jgi:hypothetical protein